MLPKCLGCSKCLFAIDGSWHSRLLQETMKVYDGHVSSCAQARKMCLMPAGLWHGLCLVVRTENLSGSVMLVMS